MQIGQLVDYCIECVNRERRARKIEEKKESGEGGTRKATQADIDSFFG